MPQASFRTKGKAKSYRPKVITAANGNPAEIILEGPVGRSIWSDDGITAKDFNDALSQFPVGSKIVVGVNSQGGAVGEGLAIFNAIQRRSADITCRIDGYAVSIASVFPLAASKVISPKSALWMIHNAWSFAEGNAQEMREAATMLDKHDDVLIAAYVDKTGMSEDEIRAMMEKETWMTGEEAVELGFADEETQEDDPTMDALDWNGFDPRAFKTIPAESPDLVAAAARKNFDFSHGALVSAKRGKAAPQNSAASLSAGGAQPKADQIMNRKKAIALLKKHGVQVPDNATDEQIEALLDTIPTAQSSSGSSNANSGATAGAQNGNGGAAVATLPPGVIVVDEAFAARMARIEAAQKQEAEERVSKVVDQCISECRIPAAQRKSWIARGVADVTVLDDLRTMPQNLPGQEPVSATIEIKSEAISDVVGHFGKLSEARNSFIRGNAITAKEMQAAAVATAIFYRKHAERLAPVMNSNTIPAELQRQVILQQIMRAFAIRIIALRAFSTVFENVPLEGTNKVEVPFYDLDTNAATDFDQNTGYTFSNSTTTFREVNVNKRKYKGLAFNSAEMRRQPYLNILQLATLAAEKLGVDVFKDVLSVVTAANYGAAVKNEVADAFSSNDVIDIKTAANQAMWPEVGRSLILDSAYDGNLQKDNAVKLALNYGGTEVIRGGKVPILSGFNYYENPSIPANGENLKGMACFNSAILVATAPILPAPGVRRILVNYEVVVEPELGIAFEYRYWGEAQPDSDFEVIECNYGFDKGNAAALLRITSP